MYKRITQLIMVIMSLYLIVWFGWQEVKAQGADWLPVKYVRIEGAFQYMSKEKVKQVITAHVMNGLYNVEVKKIQQSVKQLPWVRKVKVKRVWPDAINIKIKEKEPILRWGKNKLLSRTGQIFIPDNMNDFRELPFMSGPEGSEKSLLVKMNEMSSALLKQNMKLTEFVVNKRRSWKLKLDNNLEIKLGTNDQEKKFKRFLKTFALIGREQIKKVAAVDLRYANGYTLRWKQGEENIDWKQVAVLNKT
ncbi:MAG: FtsQ-type POTRA domain-containing protein [Methylococcales symbiont of Iophon sp. n. MRB-2018]|nr:MAG: FtsQ-type POTRA domain-containing protein [Methylococcales symbiont of Iophon sp. n. MRB-2018]KAF3979396.1 MAG: FtsQ-type POTRA domain-containing protein [Methylococcales symbiont of Iophon sp. n. MRB-2018]